MKISPNDYGQYDGSLLIAIMTGIFVVIIIALFIVLIWRTIKSEMEIRGIHKYNERFKK